MSEEYNDDEGGPFPALTASWNALHALARGDITLKEYEEVQRSGVYLVDHGQVNINPAEPRFEPGFGQTGQLVNPLLPLKPYQMTVDHGIITVDPMEPYFDSSAGETGQWINPGEVPFKYPHFG